MVRGEQTGAAISRQLDQFSVGVDNLGPQNHALNSRSLLSFKAFSGSTWPIKKAPAILKTSAIDTFYIFSIYKPAR
jgi:hypothetical protein